MIESPGSRLSRLDLLTPSEMIAARAAALGPVLEIPDRSLPDLLWAEATRHPDAVALVTDTVQLSYAELHHRASRLAHYLRDTGAGPETAIGVCLERGAELVIAILAVLAAGGTYLPLDPSQPRARLTHLIRDSGASVVLTSASCASWFEGGPAVVALDAALPDLSRYPANPPQPWPLPGQLAYLMYTSGSTGSPKGVLISHAAIVNRLTGMQHDLQLGTGDAVLHKTTITFDVSMWELLLPLIAGAQLVLAPPLSQRDPDELSRVMRQHAVTTCHFVPSMLRAFLERRPLPDSLVRVVCSGEALPADLAAQVCRQSSVELFNYYGPTEAAIDVTAHRVSVKDAGRSAIPMGRPVANSALHLLDSELRPVAVNVLADLYIGGQQLARGYLGRPGLTAERFVPDPVVAGGRLYRTGDRGRWRGDGSLEFAGRGDRQVKVRGHRVELGEVEAALLALPGVAAAAVRVWPDAAGLAELCGYVVGAGLEVKSVRAALREVLPGYAVPGRVVVLERLPMTVNGKLDWAGLPAPGGDRSGAEAGYVAPVTPVQRLLAGIWAEVLGCAQVGIHDNFFTLGGHSLMAAQVVTRIRQDAGADIEVVALFEHPTIAGLADVVVMSGLAAASAVGTDLLLDLEGMSDDEVREHLARAGLDQ
jgi:amino acid adenylation domain-containing protein